jgi:choline transport protein
MSEETKQAASVIPKAMIAAYYINGGLAFLITVTYCFVLVDYDQALESPTGLFGLPL